MALAAASLMKMGRSFLPLPRTMNSRRSRLMESRLRLISSETRKPPEKRSSMMARSLRPDSVSVGIELSKSSISS